MNAFKLLKILSLQLCNNYDYIFISSGAAIRRGPAVDLFEQHQGTHILQVCMNILKN